MSDGFAKCGIDAGLPTLPCGFEGLEYIGICKHVQGCFMVMAGLPWPRLMLACCQYAATAAASLGS